MPLTAQQVADRYASGMGGAGQRYKEGVAAFQGDPCALAADAADHWQAQVSSPAAKTNFVNGLRKPGAGESWRKNSMEIGAARLQSGAQKGKPKYMAALNVLLPAAERSKAAAREMRKNGTDWLERVRQNGEIMKQAFGKPS